MIAVPAVRSDAGVWIFFETWFIWRWLQRFPDDVAYRAAADVQHREIVG